MDNNIIGDIVNTTFGEIMEKKNIETFIKKYTLGGNLSQVRWSIKDSTLRVSAMTGDKKLMATVLLKTFAGVDNSIVGILDSAKIKQMLGALGDNISFVLGKDPEDESRIINLILSDDKTEVTFTAADVDVIAAEPKLKSLPDFGLEIVLSDTFVERFLKSKAALPEADFFTLATNKKKQKLEMILGHGKNNYNKIAFDVTPVAGKDVLKSPISFSAKILKEVISANDECKDAILKVSEDGISSIEYDKDNFQSQYYLIKVEVED